MMSTQWFDPIPTLGFLAAQTTRTRVMTNVFVAAYQHPLQTAKAFATLDALSGGRTIVGVGVGHVEGEFEVLGVPFKERGARTDEAIDAITAALDRRMARAQRASTGASRTSVSGRGRCRSRARRSGSAGTASPRCDASRHAATAGSRKARRRKQLPDDIAYILRHRDEVRPGAVPEMGFITETRVRRRAELRHRSVLRFRLTRAARRVVQPAGRHRHQSSPVAVREPIRVGALRPGCGVRHRSRSAPHPARARLDTKGYPCRCSPCARTSALRPSGPRRRATSTVPRSSR